MAMPLRSCGRWGSELQRPLAFGQSGRSAWVTVNKQAYERVIASVLRAHPAATREGVAEMLWELAGVRPDEREAGVMSNAGAETVLATMRRLKIPVTRESYLAFIYPDGV